MGGSKKRVWVFLSFFLFDPSRNSVLHDDQVSPEASTADSITISKSGYVENEGLRVLHGVKAQIRRIYKVDTQAGQRKDSYAS